MESIKQKCGKCKEAPATVINRNKPQCRQCFLNVINHKFRSNLRTNCKIRHEDHVLVCISGDNSSMAMLSLLNKTLNECTTNKRLFFKLKVLHIDDSLFLKEKEAIVFNREQRFSALKHLCTQYHFDLSVLPLEHSLSLPPLNSPLLQLNEAFSMETDMNSIERYLSLYNSLDFNGGYKKQFNCIMTQNLLFDYALASNFTKLIYAASGQSLVSNVFSDIVGGRGASIRDKVDSFDTHFLGRKVQILKPMKDFFTKEILLYNYFNKLEVMYPSNLEVSRMNQILDSFFTGLQKERINTVPSVINTTEKLTKLANDNPCTFCLNCIEKPCSQLVIGKRGNDTANDIFNRTDLCFGCKRMFNKLTNSQFTAQVPAFLIKKGKDKSESSID